MQQRSLPPIQRTNPHDTKRRFDAMNEETAEP
jgi:hypothetical protein